MGAYEARFKGLRQKNIRKNRKNRKNLLLISRQKVFLLFSLSFALCGFAEVFDLLLFKVTPAPAGEFVQL